MGAAPVFANTEIIIAIIGVIGTLAGTILGWGLNSLSQKGKLNFYVHSWKEEFQFNKMGEMVPSSSVEETETYGYEFVLDIYNSSSNTAIMRDISILFMNDRDKLFCSTPYDYSTRRVSVVAFYDEVTAINIPPKSVKTIKLLKSMWHSDKEFQQIWKVNSIFLSYRDQKNKKRKVLLQKVNYQQYFAS